MATGVEDSPVIPSCRELVIKWSELPGKVVSSLSLEVCKWRWYFFICLESLQWIQAVWLWRQSCRREHLREHVFLSLPFLSLSTCSLYSATILWGSPTSPCREITWEANIAHQTCEWADLQMVSDPSFWVFQLRLQISWSKDKLFSQCPSRIPGSWKLSELMNYYSFFMPLNFVVSC